jgi:hypothetical protein
MYKIDVGTQISVVFYMIGEHDNRKKIEAYDVASRQSFAEPTNLDQGLTVRPCSLPADPPAACARGRLDEKGRRGRRRTKSRCIPFLA